MGIGGESMCQHTLFLSLSFSRSPSLRCSYTRSLPHWLPPFAVSEGWGFTGGPFPSCPTQGSQNSDATSIISRPFQIEPELEEGMRALAPPTPSSLFLSFSLPFIRTLWHVWSACPCTLEILPVWRNLTPLICFAAAGLRKRANCKRKLKFNGTVMVFNFFWSLANLIDPSDFLDECFWFYCDWFICAFYLKIRYFFPTFIKMW